MRSLDMTGKGHRARSWRGNTLAATGTTLQLPWRNCMSTSDPRAAIRLSLIRHLLFLVVLRPIDKSGK